MPYFSCTTCKIIAKILRLNSDLSRHCERVSAWQSTSKFFKSFTLAP
ncbi:hypothetical protein HFN_2149 [Helicobacter fennelliae MRY12-0050]|uniref:Uncharacterized protein n=1 Tax=Helicobacter fennelliae MRY12-0050 TaxID=1325130 RepID=T1DVP3_9HELI|nr:hypothetical protein HFN_2149 [Helicobacter fennelliae MRY12-0050]